MQISTVSYVNLAETRDAVSVASSGGTELKSKDSSLAAVSEAAETESSGRESEQKPSDNASSESSLATELTEQELQQVRKLAARDREVRAHEQAHQSAGGQYTGAASFTYQRGPDGLNYAIGGEVSIDASKVTGDPQATIEKAEVVRRAALAPAEPSAQDRQVAAQASQVKLEAQAELAELRAEASEAATEESEESSKESDESSEAVNTTGRGDATQAASTDEQDEAESSDDDTAESDVQVDDGSLTPEDFSYLLASEIARRNAMAVFENINRDPPKGNLDELV
ncbi:putative metalloprotease CJM1_0395 family protein [Litoribrevibacter euphylliae]|uniref:Metalloprotease CJM1_0395 family protein n=1 Tax=Litoribrevibacter euphylliae TaxID=1834034 RepID=A0ABV7HLK3_9GAMM